QFSFRDSVEPIYRELVDLLLDSNKSFKIEPDYLQQAISTVDSLQLAEMENFFRCNLSQLVRVNQEISKKNLPAVFIYPIILRDKLVVIYQLPGGKLEQHTEYISYKEVESTAKNLRNAIANRRGITNYSQEIYKWIMKPLFDEYLTSENEVETLVFVLDGYLRNIPVAALWDEEGGKDKEGEYLIQKKYSLALLPGSQFFDLEDKSHNQSILAVGIDTLNKNKEKQYYVEGKPFTAIDISELDKIGAKKKLINDKFTQSNLQKEIKTGKFSVVHIASHGNFSSNPEETYIVAYNSKDSRGKLLKAKDLDNLFQVSNQKDFGTIKLLVLSACDTAGGDNRAILGLAGLAVKAGARSTLSTLWRVEDNATTELMERFYKEWKAKEVTKAEALHRAQLALLENPKTQHPYKWAPYILIGNWQ
ncbi:CHAT domain-containing protein, partial [Mastigocoleus sp. MO_188.B34]|uniref:CHAT domain-containing protein n=1 Tax=Mastigocoleus sp. MO_188.B34 TaxID=3036635 RepID=UPI0026061AD9